MCLAVPGEVQEILSQDALTRTAKVGFAGIVKEINLALVPSAIVGDFVLVHAGIAIAVIDADSAARTLDTLLNANVLDAADVALGSEDQTNLRGKVQ